MKRLIIILTLFLSIINSFAFAAQSNVVKKDIKVLATDGFSLSATLEYPKNKDKQDFSTVVLLHSLGYNSEWWETLPQELLDSGYAVLLVDLRGHGKSVYNSKLVRVSWKSLTNNAYAKYPSDVIKVIEYVKSENKRTFFNNWAIVGADIGAGTAIVTANKISYKPKTIVMLSPIVKAKGICTPVKLAELDNIDILSVSGNNDFAGQRSQEYLSKFAQSTFSKYISDSKSTGMLLLKNDRTLTPFITKWISDYLK